ncbi:nickel-responsive transcriptional regulator NikR [Shumkonia mesophila]|uniref:nickel-responsive transcriptional regulator NikR n=1 Tax=Shumkonia mesophila TaxID=2838854 RepID=UPI0029342F26|nr:nickel-responsive transcriptional regulator NikR [Shumkonia mesophila]
MERITITVDGDLLAQFDAYMKRNGYENRSEAFRDLVRGKLEGERIASGDAAFCVGCLSYIYDHHERELARRLTQAQHDHHDLNLSTLHVHLDHDTCLEAMIVQGPTEAVKSFGNGVIAERGVRHGNLHIVPADVKIGRHAHGTGSDIKTPHVHSRPRT